MSDAAHFLPLPICQRLWNSFHVKQQCWEKPVGYIQVPRGKWWESLIYAGCNFVAFLEDSLPCLLGHAYGPEIRMWNHRSHALRLFAPLLLAPRFLVASIEQLDSRTFPAYSQSFATTSRLLSTGTPLCGNSASQQITLSGPYWWLANDYAVITS